MYYLLFKCFYNISNEMINEMRNKICIEMRNKIRNCYLMKIDWSIEESVHSIVESHSSSLSRVGRTSCLDSNCRTTFVVVS